MDTGDVHQFIATVIFLATLTKKDIFSSSFYQWMNRFFVNLLTESCEFDAKIFSICWNHPEVFLGIGVLKICSKFTGEYPYRSEISVKLVHNFIEVTLCHGYSPVNLLHIYGTAYFSLEHLWMAASDNLKMSKQHIFILQTISCRWD